MLEETLIFLTTDCSQNAVASKVGAQLLLSNYRGSSLCDKYGSCTPMNFDLSPSIASLHDIRTNIKDCLLSEAHGNLNLLFFMM